MKTIKHHLDKTLLLACIILLIAIKAPTSPQRITVPSRDSGVFLYMGQSILNGEIPYRDVWDHKPPLIFYINALGLLMGGGSWWGVWILELVFLSAATGIGYELLKRQYNRFTALFVTILWLITFSVVMEGGNFTETYALLFQYFTLIMFFTKDTSASPVRSWALIGAAGALSFLLRQNLIGIWVAIGLRELLTALSSEQRKQHFIHLGAAFLGGTAILGLVILLFALNGSFSDMWEAAFEYNFSYTNSTLADRYYAFWAVWFRMSWNGLGNLGLSGWLMYALMMLSKHDFLQRLAENQRELLSVAFFGLPIEFLLASLSGRIFAHYSITLLPLLSINAGFLIYILVPSIDQAQDVPPRAGQKLRALGLATLLLTINNGAKIINIVQTAMFPQENPEDMNKELVLDYIAENTEPDDYLLMWGGESAYNFMSGRRAPSRFVYQFPLFDDFLPESFDNSAYIEQFIADLQTHPPELIFDTSTSNKGVIPLTQIPPDSELFPVAEYIQSNYVRDPAFVSDSGDQWTAYRWLGPQE